MRKLRHFITPFALAATLVVAGCSSTTPRTQIMVFVQAESAVLGSTDRLEIEILAGPIGSPRSSVASLVYTDAGSDEGHPLEWPLQIALVPEGGDADRSFEVRVEAQGMGSFVAEAKVISSYIDQETLSLEVWLRDACSGVSCGSTQTCQGGGCAPTPTVDPCDLQRLEGGGSACDPATDGGTPGDGGTPTDAGPPPDGDNIVFVTFDLRQPADLGGLAGADAFCRDQAQMEGLQDPTTYVALLSDSSIDARDRLAGARGWVRTDGRPFLDQPEDIELGRIYYPLELDQFGIRVASQFVITGSEHRGILNGSTCGDWDTGGMNSDVVVGSAWEGTGRWMDMSRITCSTPARLYCFGTGRGGALTPPSNTGSVIFRSNGTVVPMAGPMAMDMLCQTEATNAGLGGTFVALVAGNGSSAADRLSAMDAPWVRPDGALIATTLGELSSNQLETSISVSAGGNGYSNGAVLVGASTIGSNGLSLTTCGGWANSTGNYLVGQSGSTSQVFSMQTQRCDLPAVVYCVETGP